MKEKLLKKGKNMGKNGVFANSLILNHLEKSTKIFGSFTFFSYLYFVRLINKQ